jgi:P27 family predicted phage terminase small subunit
MPTPRVPRSQHELSGTRCHYIDDDAEMHPGKPKSPKNISAEAKATFKRLCKLLSRRRTLTEGDAELLRLYAVTFDRHRRALEHLALEGEICGYERLDSKGQPHTFFKDNLWLKIATDSEKYMRAVLGDCGLNPMSRGKVKEATPKPPTQEETFPSREGTTMPSREIDLNTIDEKVAV